MAPAVMNSNFAGRRRFSLAVCFSTAHALNIGRGGGSGVFFIIIIAGAHLFFAARAEKTRRLDGTKTRHYLH